MKNLYKTILIIGTIMMLSQTLSQIPIEKNHPSQILIKRYSALGDAPLEYFGKNNLGLIISNNYLEKNENDLQKVNTWDIKLPQKDSIEYTSSLKYKLNYFSKGITNFNFNKPKKYLYQFVSEEALAWINIKEEIILDPSGKLSDIEHKSLQFLDQLSFNSIINDNIFISTKFSMYRHSGEDILILDKYNNEWVKYFPVINMNFWYTNQTSLYIKNSLIDLEIANNTFSWGWSSGASPILAANAIPFNRFSLYKNVGLLNLEYFHGSLTSTSIRNIHLANIKKEKYIAGHRATLKLNKNFHIALSELVIYGNRSPEVGYLNPISFFWAKEHNLGDLDNILIAIDFGLRVKPGAIFYSTFIMDELSWQDIMSDWWGNKYSYQIGLFLTSANMYLPDFRLEYNVTRPWTYTHPDFSYTHREKTLGSPYGPNSRAIRLESFFFPIPKIMVESSYEYILKGIGDGSNVLDNYDERNQALDWGTKFFLEGNKKLSELNIKINYIISDLLTIKSSISSSKFLNPLFIDSNKNIKEKRVNISLNFNW